MIMLAENNQIQLNQARIQEWISSLKVQRMYGQFKPSAYQGAILEWIQNPTSLEKLLERELTACEEQVLVVNATAGSGKTTTLVEIAKALPMDQKSRFMAFSKEIQITLEKKLPNWVDCSTLHSFGFGAIKKWSNNKKRQYCNGRKYNDIAKILLETEGLDYNVIYAYQKQLVELSGFFRNCTPTEDPSDTSVLDELVKRYQLEIPDRAIVYRLLPQLLKDGIRMSRMRIDFADMIWLPVLLNIDNTECLKNGYGIDLAQIGIIPVETYDNVLIDECQDLNTAQRMLVMRSIRQKTGRAVFVGDRNQAIYAFSGADYKSIDSIVEETGALELPLSVCYRCGSEIVKEAQKIVPGIEARPQIHEGIIRRIKAEIVEDELEEGDLVLCRVTASLIALCFDLIGAGKPARVKGRQIGDQLKTVLKEIQSIVGFDISNFMNFLSQWEENKITKIMGGKEPNELAIEAVRDKAKCIETIFMKASCKSVNDIEKAIDELFDEKGRAIELCTIHRAKGLEAKRVYIIRPDLIPHPKAKTEEDLLQEANLEFVAITRAIEQLTYVNGKI